MAHLLKNRPGLVAPQQVWSVRPAYLKDVQQFAEFLRGRDKCLESAEPADAAAFLEGVLKPNYALTTIARKISELRQTYAVFGAKVNPFAAIHIDVPERPQKPDLSKKMDRVLKEIMVSDAKCVRDMALLALAAYERLRTCQLEQLNIEDINLQAGTANVFMRGGLQNLIYLNNETLPYLRRWLAVRQSYQTDTSAVFISMHWTNGRAAPYGRMSKRAIYAVRVLYAKRAN